MKVVIFVLLYVIIGFIADIWAYTHERKTSQYMMSHNENWKDTKPEEVDEYFQTSDTTSQAKIRRFIIMSFSLLAWPIGVAYSLYEDYKTLKEIRD